MLQCVLTPVILEHCLQLWVGKVISFNQLEMYNTYVCVHVCIFPISSVVFKILKIFSDHIQVSHDLRDLPSKQLNLNFSSNDVQWNPKDGKLWCHVNAMN